jgi:hypothetical protein
LAVNIFLDPALEKHAIQAAPNASWGVNDNDVFGHCLSENLNAWQDMNDDYPVFN